MKRPALTAVRSAARQLLFAAAVVSLVLAACSPSAPAASGPASGGSAVTIQNFAFSPVSLTVAAGTTVTWTDKDNTEHTVSADDGSFGSQKLTPGATFSETFSTPGTYAYHCSIHRTMTATVIVH